MTTHDDPRETNAPEVDAATASADPRSERWVGSPTADTPMAPDTATDPGWQRHADQFAATRVRRSGVHASASQTEPTMSIGDQDLDGYPGTDTGNASDTSLFGGAQLEEFRGQWNSVQAGFVDDPKRCVEQADGLVSAVVEQLSSGFTEARSRLEQQWSRGEDASTEDLRVALKRYREFFDRLLAV